MNNFSKMLVGSSLVLGAVLFSVGCGGDSFCCEDGEPPIPQIKNAPDKYSLDGTTKLVLDGITTNMDDGKIVKCNWYIDGKLQSYTGGSCAKVELNFAGMSGQPEVCLEVIDNDGISSTNNNGLIANDKKGVSSSKKEGNLEKRKKMDCRTVAITAAKQEQKLDLGVDVLKGGTGGGAHNLITDANKVKQGCPYEFRPNLNLKAGTTCNWTIDNNPISDTSCKLVTDKTETNTGEHEICLTVNKGKTGEQEVCKKFNVSEHDAPTAVMGIYTGQDLTTPVTGKILNTDTTIGLSCKGSKNDCPQTEEGIECEWNAKSWEIDSRGNCQTSTFDDNTGLAHSDCFAVDGERDNKFFGGKITTPSTTSKQYVCGITNNKKRCVEIGLKVTDTRFTPNKVTTVPNKKFEVQ